MDQSLKQEWTVSEAETSGEGGNGESIPLYHIWTGEHTLPLYESDKDAVQEVCDAHNAELEEYKYKAWMYDQLNK